MAIKIGKGSGKYTTIGNSDYPQDSFRAMYSATKVTLIARKGMGLLEAPKLTFKYSDLQDLTGAALGATEAIVRPKLAVALYSADDAPAG